MIEANGVAPCYIRPIALRGYGEIGVSPKGSPIEVYIANFPWGKYIAGHGGADVCVSSWNRLAPNTMPALAKAGANYMNSQLIRMEAEINGYQEGIALDVNGLVSEGSGENIFVVRNGAILYAAAGQLRPLRNHPRQRADHRPPPGHSQSPSKPSLASCFTLPTRSSSPALPPKSRLSARSTAS